MQGAPTEVILRYTEQLKADMIVMAAAQGLKTMGWRRMVDLAPNAALVARPR